MNYDRTPLLARPCGDNHRPARFIQAKTAERMATSLEARRAIERSETGEYWRTLRHQQPDVIRWDVDSGQAVICRRPLFVPDTASRVA